MSAHPLRGDLHRPDPRVLVLPSEFDLAPRVSTPSSIDLQLKQPIILRPDQRQIIREPRARECLIAKRHRAERAKRDRSQRSKRRRRARRRRAIRRLPTFHDRLLTRAQRAVRARRIQISIISRHLRDLARGAARRKPFDRRRRSLVVATSATRTDESLQSKPSRARAPVRTTRET